MSTTAHATSGGRQERCHWARRLLVGVIAGAWACGAPGPNGPALESITFLTNYVFIGRHAPFFVGMDRGFYREAGFEIEVQPATGSASVISAIEGGQADYGIAEVASVIQAAGKGARVKGFGVFMDTSTSGLASLEPFPAPRDIMGRTVAASLTDSARIILPIVLGEAGLDATSVTWEAADPSVYFSLLLGGRADLITASIDSDVPALRRVAEPRGETIHFASFADWGYDVYGYFLVARDDRLASSPDQARAFLAATARSVQYAIEHPQQAAESLVRHSPALDLETALAQWRESMATLASSTVSTGGYGTATPDRLQRSIDLVSDAFELDSALSPDDVFVDGIVAP